MRSLTGWQPARPRNSASGTSNLFAFFVVIIVKNKTGGESFDDYKGLGWEMPFVGAAMTLFMVSLTGLPPTAGFIGKFYIFASLIKEVVHIIG